MYYQTAIQNIFNLLLKQFQFVLKRCKTLSHFVLELLLPLFNNAWDLLISYLTLKLFIGCTVPGKQRELFFFLLGSAVIVVWDLFLFVSRLYFNYAFSLLIFTILLVLFLCRTMTNTHRVLLGHFVFIYK